MKVSARLRSCSWYFIGLFIVLLTVISLLIISGKTVSFIATESYHPFLLNVFFINFTFIGDGIFAVCLSALFLFYYKQKEKGLAFFYSFLISGIAIQLIKNLVNEASPKLFFEAGQYLHVVDGVNLANTSVFPSGHTATAFAIATVIVMMMKEKRWQLLILIAAVMVGYSRIYLAQHFLLDVIVGAVIGSCSGILSVYITSNRKIIRKSIKNLHQFNTDSPSSVSAIQPV